MSHHIYTTRGVIVSVFPSREADKVIGVFTQELGLIYATARGARNITSKLSPALQELNLVKISLVRGKHTWRVTTVTLIANLASELRGKRAALGAIFRVGALLKRLMHGEEKHALLYNDIERALILLRDDVGEGDVDAWELLTVAKTLFHLGYLSEESLPKNIIETREKRSAVINLVNSGIHASGLG